MVLGNYVWFLESIEKIKEKMSRKFIFSYLVCLMKNIKENQTWLKLVRNLCTFKSFRLYISKLK